ncbi:MAG: sugar transferase [Candidatus Omnitrophica bacterium]|nr:sugar transferase [Candidatus Omnitrophota bacterium]
MKNRKAFIFLDFIAVITGMLLGYGLRFSLTVFPNKGIAPIAPYLQISIFAALVWIAMLSINQIYRSQTFTNPCLELSKITQSSFYSCIIISAVTFFYRGFSYSRIAIIIGVVVSFLLLSLVHILMSFILKNQHTQFLLIGNENDFTSLSKRLRIHGANTIKFLSPDELAQNDCSLLKKNTCVIMCLDNRQNLEQIEKFCHINNICYFIYPKSSQVFLSGGRVEEIDGIPVITTQIFPLEFWHNRIIKRIFDIVFSMILLLIFLPVLILIAAIIKISSDGPALFIQKRIGLKNKEFKIFKFRTMKHGTETVLPYTLEKDPRITRIGKFLRKTNIDELPQLFNVIKGEMSLVGPRPVSTKDKIFFSIPGFYERMKILPGMTGWAQIHGLKGGQIEPEERFRYDLYYAENWSIWLDFAIIIFTAFLFFGKNGKKITQ